MNTVAFRGTRSARIARCLRLAALAACFVGLAAPASFAGFPGDISVVQTPVSVGDPIYVELDLPDLRQPAPGAISIGKRAFAPLEEMVVTTALPSGPNHHTAWVAVQPRGSTLDYGDFLDSFHFEAGAAGTVQSTLYAPSEPGPYTINLHHSTGYTIDSVDIEVAATAEEAQRINDALGRTSEPKSGAFDPDDDPAIAAERDSAAAPIEGPSEVEVVQNPDGPATTVWTRSFEYPDGSRRLIIQDSDGGLSEVLVLPDGTIRISATTPDGEPITIERDGGEDAIKVGLGDGNVVEATPVLSSDGQSIDKIVVESDDKEETTSLSADGTLSYSDQLGRVVEIKTAEDGSTTTTHADEAGNHVVVERDADGNVKRAKAYRLDDVEPGREYYEKVIGGTAWESLSPADKQRHANSEQMERDRAEVERIRRLQEETNERRDRLEEERKAARYKVSDEQYAQEQAEFAQRQQEIQRREDEIRRREERRQQLEDMYAKTAELKQDYQAARERGDFLEMQRIIKLQDEHDVASQEVLALTDDEKRDMEQKQVTRDRLGDLVNALAAGEAAGDLEIAAIKGKTIEQIVNNPVINTLLQGAEYQQKTHRTDRAVEDEAIRAKHRVAVIDRMMSDTSLTTEERKILNEKLNQARSQYAAATILEERSKLLAGMGYAADVVNTIAGGKIIQGTGKVVQGGVGAVRGLMKTGAKKVTESAMRGSVPALTTVAVAKEVAAGAARAGEEFMSASRIVASASADAARAFGDTTVEVAEYAIGRDGVNVIAEFAEATKQLTEKVATGTAQIAKKTADVAFADVSVESIQDAARAVQNRARQRAASSVTEATAADLPPASTPAVEAAPAAQPPRDVPGAASASERADTVIEKAGPAPPKTEPYRAAPSVDESLSSLRKSTESARAEAETAINQMLKENRRTDDETLAWASRRAANDMSVEAMEDLVKEARTLGVPEARIARAIPDPATVRPSEFDGVLRRLQGEVLTKIGVETVDSLDANAIRRLAVRARTGDLVPEDTDTLRGLLNTAEGTDPFERMARLGHMSPVDGLTPLLTEADIAAIRRTAERRRPVPSVPNEPTSTLFQKTLPYNPKIPSDTMPASSAAAETPPLSVHNEPTVILSEEEIARGVKSSIEPPKSRPDAPPLSVHDEPTVILSEEEIARGVKSDIEPPKPRPDAPAHDAPTVILREQQMAPAQPPVEPRAAPPTVDELTPEDLARWAEEPLEDAIARLEAKDTTPEGLNAGEYLELRRLRAQFNGPAEVAARQRVAAELRQRQEQAELFDLSGVENARIRPQPTLENGELPRRKLVEGDQNYVANIMAGTPYRPKQNKIYFETVNDYVEQILRGDAFPEGRGNGKIWIGPDRIIREGHHRMIAAQIVSRLTGRPVFPYELTGQAPIEGLLPIIPLEMIDLRQATAPALPFPWRRIGVLDAPAK